MDWSNFGGAYMAQPQEDVEDDEDFYGYDQNHSYTNGNDHMQTTAGASTQEQQPAIMAKEADVAKPDSKSPMTPPLEDQKKIEQQNKLEDLRKRLLAKRGNARSNTPVKTPVNIQSPQQKMEQQESETASKSGADERPGQVDEFGIDTLLAEGKAAAQAKTARENQAAALAASPATTGQQPSVVSGTSDMEVDPVPQKAADVEQKNTPPNARPLNMSDPYYDDLPVWLEFTGYHDVQFRNSKLSTYKERRELEQEAARIAQKLEQLKQAERADLDSLRATTAHLHTPASATMAPPPLPTSMPQGDQRPDLFANGIKRPHSPDVASSQKASRRNNDPGYRFRGANDQGANLPRDNGSPIDRRGSQMPDRRRSIEERAERDPSLERRQKHYNQREGPPPHPSLRGNAYNGDFQRNFNRDGPRPFNAREREGRPGFSSVNRVGPNPHPGSAGLDLRKGGVRYIMIKSWCSDNVTQAMKDGLWATQEKNQGLLTEAFHTSRHVILLFSVNRSMAFQGYALMTSPPDPSLPMPSFCNKLNWATSPAFTLRWLATTPVHFRLVGHLKNTCNPDEEGQPRAVLVGKDGQEISQDAGMGVVLILDEADEVEGRGRLREQEKHQ